MSDLAYLSMPIDEDFEVPSDVIDAAEYFSLSLRVAEELLRIEIQPDEAHPWRLMLFVTIPQGYGISKMGVDDACFEICSLIYSTHGIFVRYVVVEEEDDETD